MNLDGLRNERVDGHSVVGTFRPEVHRSESIDLGGDPKTIQAPNDRPGRSRRVGA